jgi:hypothetical protein
MGVRYCRHRYASSRRWKSGSASRQGVLLARQCLTSRMN